MPASTEQPKQQMYRPAIFPVFIFYSCCGIAGALIGAFPGFSMPLKNVSFFVMVLFLLAAMATLLTWLFGYRALTPEGVSTGMLFRHQNLWRDLDKVQHFPRLRLVLLYFKPEKSPGRSFFILQRRRGEFCGLLAKVLPKDSAVWQKLGDGH